MLNKRNENIFKIKKERAAFAEVLEQYCHMNLLLIMLMLENLKARKINSL